MYLNFSKSEPKYYHRIVYGKYMKLLEPPIRKSQNGFIDDVDPTRHNGPTM